VDGTWLGRARSWLFGGIGVLLAACVVLVLALMWWWDYEPDHFDVVACPVPKSGQYHRLIVSFARF